MVYQYSYHATNNLLLMQVIQPGTNKIVWQGNYPSFSENALTGELDEDATPLDLGVMQSVQDVQGLQSFLINNKIINADDSIQYGKQFADGGSVDDSTPVKNTYNKRVENLDKSNRISDKSQLEVGDYVAILPNDKSSGFTGFVKSIGRKNFTAESLYGGWGTSDAQLMELSGAIADIDSFYKPKKSNSDSGAGTVLVNLEVDKYMNDHPNEWLIVEDCRFNQYQVVGSNKLFYLYKKEKGQHKFHATGLSANSAVPILDSIRKYCEKAAAGQGNKIFNKIFFHNMREQPTKTFTDIRFDEVPFPEEVEEEKDLGTRLSAAQKKYGLIGSEWNIISSHVKKYPDTDIDEVVGLGQRIANNADKTHVQSHHYAEAILYVQSKSENDPTYGRLMIGDVMDLVRYGHLKMNILERMKSIGILDKKGNADLELAYKLQEAYDNVEGYLNKSRKELIQLFFDKVLVPIAEKEYHYTGEFAAVCLKSLYTNLYNNRKGMAITDAEVAEAIKKESESIGIKDTSKLKKGEEPKPQKIAYVGNYVPLHKQFLDRYGVEARSVLDKFVEMYKSDSWRSAEQVCSEAYMELSGKEGYNHLVFDDMCIAMLELDFYAIKNLNLKKKEKPNPTLDQNIGGEIHLPSLDKTLPKTTDPMKALSPLTATDDLRPAMTGIYHNAAKQIMVATNGNVLGVLPQKITGESRIVSLKDGSIIDARFPQYEAVIPTDYKYKIEGVSLTTWFDQLSSMNAADRFFYDDKTVPVISARLVTDYGFIELSAELLLDVVTFFLRCGVKQVNVELSTLQNPDGTLKPKGVLIRAAGMKEMLALIMPLYSNNADRSTVLYSILALPGQSAPEPTPAPKKEKKEKPVKPAKKESTVEEDTPIIPEIIADSVAAEVVSEHPKLKDLSQEQKASIQSELIAHLLDRTKTHYQESDHFKKQINERGDRGRDNLYMFMKHWSEAFVGKMKVPAPGASSKVVSQDEAEKMQEDQLFESALTDYKSASAEKRKALVKIVQNNLDRHDDGESSIGMGLEAVKVRAGKRFMEAIKGIGEHENTFGPGAKESALTKSVLNVKSKYPEATVWLFDGSYVQALGIDAEHTSNVLGTTITTNDAGVKITGFPNQNLDAYLHKMVKAGYKVALVQDDPAGKNSTKVIRDVDLPKEYKVIGDDAREDVMPKMNWTIEQVESAGHKFTGYVANNAKHYNMINIAKELDMPIESLQVNHLGDHKWGVFKKKGIEGKYVEHPMLPGGANKEIEDKPLSFYLDEVRKATTISELRAIESKYQDAVSYTLTVNEQGEYYDLVEERKDELRQEARNKRVRPSKSKDTKEAAPKSVETELKSQKSKLELKALKTFPGSRTQKVLIAKLDSVNKKIKSGNNAGHIIGKNGDTQLEHVNKLSALDKRGEHGYSYWKEVAEFIGDEKAKKELKSLLNGKKPEQLDSSKDFDKFLEITNQLSSDYFTYVKDDKNLHDDVETEKPVRTERAIAQDKHLKAMKPGKRISDDGSVYYEYRDNRTDSDRRKKFAAGGSVDDEKQLEKLKGINAYMQKYVSDNEGNIMDLKVKDYKRQIRVNNKLIREIKERNKKAVSPTMITVKIDGVDKEVILLKEYEKGYYIEDSDGSTRLVKKYAAGGKIKGADRNYKFFVLNKSGKVVAGFEYREDAKDFTKEVDAACDCKIYTSATVKSRFKYDPYDYENWDNL